MAATAARLLRRAARLPPCSCARNFATAAARVEGTDVVARDEHGGGGLELHDPMAIEIPAAPSSPIADAFPRDLVGPLDPETNLRPVRVARPSYESSTPLLYSAADAAHPYQAEELGPVTTTGGELEIIRSELAADELAFRLQRDRLANVERKFWAATNARWRAKKAEAERDGVPEHVWVAEWVRDNHAAYRDNHARWWIEQRRMLVPSYWAFLRRVTWAWHNWRAGVRQTR